MKNNIFSLFLDSVTLAVLMLMTCAAFALDASQLSSQDAISGLKTALDRASQAAVAQLGAENGFFGNDKLRIPLPQPLQRAEGLMRQFGMGRQADDLVLRINRAAEAAVPEARALLLQSIRQMSFQDAKGIVTGADDAATQYFRRTTSEPLAKKFEPIVSKAMAKVELAQRYDEFAKAGARFGLVKAEDADLKNYITRKALDGLFTVIAEQEKNIRANPAASASAIIQKVFGALRK